MSGKQSQFLAPVICDGCEAEISGPVKRAGLLRLCAACHQQDEADRTPASPDEVADLRARVRRLEAALSASTETAAGLAREVVTLSRLQISLSRSR
tara:strand:+ start:841 stop:1128 length:288 start_codon:yes stop_codon:yes gene_type:complete